MPPSTRHYTAAALRNVDPAEDPLLRSSTSTSIVRAGSLPLVSLTDEYSTVFDRMVTIRVGNGEEPDVDLHVYRGLLSHHSKTFQKLLDSQPDEPALIDISGEADTFRLFFRWLNTGSLADYGLPSWQDIIDVYLFAEEFDVRALQNHALDMFLRKHADSNEVPVNAAHIVYHGPSTGDSLRRLLTHVVAERWGFEHSRTTEQDLPSAFLHDLIDHLRLHGRVPGNLVVPRKEWVQRELETFCGRFHVHTEDEVASNTGNLPVLPTMQHLGITDGPSEVLGHDAIEQPSHCDKCGEPGHVPVFCPFNKPDPRPPCFNCDRSDHVFRDCPEPKDWSKHRCGYCKQYGHSRRVSALMSGCGGNANLTSDAQPAESAQGRQK